MIEKVIGWGPAALWAAVLFLLSAWSEPTVGLDSGIDKLVHGGAYLVLGLSLAWGRARTTSGVPVAVLILAGVGYGVLVEWYQTLVPSREAEFMDGLANALGVVVGYVLFTRFVPYSRRGEKAPDQGTRASSTVQT
jgi:VanZ family protein